MNTESVQTTNGETISAQARALAGQYLTFEVAGDRYGVPILRAREIISYESISRVPGTPDFIRGVINVRGDVVPVIDLAKKLGLVPSEVTRWTCLILIEIEQDEERRVLAIVADSVRQVVDLNAANISETPDFGTRVHTRYLLGMGRDGSDFVLLLDIQRVLDADELIAVESLDNMEVVGGDVAEDLDDFDDDFDESDVNEPEYEGTAQASDPDADSND